jgi:pSer/pThr/pTyr-binding forkhead associated (FHA) protein
VTPLQDNWVTLHLLDTGELLPLAGRNEFTLGRGSDTQSVMPDIDLSPYRAYSSGVSRLHAVIRRGISQIVLTDLESANGTFVNGKRIEPNEEQALAHGDVIALGKLKIQILLKAP